MILQKFLSRANIETEDFFTTLDPNGEGLEMNKMKDALANIPHSITEVKHSCHDITRNYCIVELLYYYVRQFESSDIM